MKFTHRIMALFHLGGQQSGPIVLMAAAALVMPAVTSWGEPHRAHLSEDLEQRLSAGDGAETRVILTATQARVDAVAARHGARVVTRLSTGAVLSVPAGALGGLAADLDVDQLSSDQIVRSHMAVTDPAIGADLVQSGGWGGTGLNGAGVGVHRLALLERGGRAP